MHICVYIPLSPPLPFSLSLPLSLLPSLSPSLSIYVSRVPGLARGRFPSQDRFLLGQHLGSRHQN